jgi:hypothetical protein
MLQLGSSAMNRTEGQGHIFIDFVSSVQVYRGHSCRTILLRLLNLVSSICTNTQSHKVIITWSIERGSILIGLFKSNLELQLNVKNGFRKIRYSFCRPTIWKKNILCLSFNSLLNIGKPRVLSYYVITLIHYKPKSRMAG